MPRRILIIIGHPDPEPRRLCRALAASYADGARSAGHEVRLVDVATIDFPLLRTQEEFVDRALPVTLEDAAQAIGEAEHIVFVFPLWLGTMPALLKAFLEQVMRPGVAFAYPDNGKAGLCGTRISTGRGTEMRALRSAPRPAAPSCRRYRCFASSRRAPCRSCTLPG